MEAIKIELISKELRSKLSYDNLKDMNTESFKEFVFVLFKQMDDLRKEGLVKDDLLECVNRIHYVQSKYFEENSLFEERLGIITDELISYCPSPFFWDIELNDYMNKWNRWFDKKLIY